MATDYLCIVKLPAKSSIPADTVQHSWAFESSVGDATHRASIATALQNFYNNVPSGGTVAPGAYLSDTVSRTTSPFVVFYDVTSSLTGTRHGSPVDEITFGAGLPAASGAALPSEMAACLSFHGDYGTDVEFGVGTRPRARDRGRMFFGPLLQLAMDQDATTRRPRLTSAFRTNLTLAMGTLAAIADPFWAVWSRRAIAFKNVTGGWVDDAFDVQRRRGEAPVVRSTF